jgi:hypothetical protein
VAQVSVIDAEATPKADHLTALRRVISGRSCARAWRPDAERDSIAARGVGREPANAGPSPVWLDLSRPCAVAGANAQAEHGLDSVIVFLTPIPAGGNR